MRSTNLSHPLYIAFIWHQHQPIYREVNTNHHVLPWVRFHGTKDYLHMMEVLARFPRVHQTVNLVPSLVEQLDDYVDHEATDPYLTLSRKPVESWTPADRLFALNHFFDINHDRLLNLYPRYRQLWEMRQQVQDDVTLLSETYFRDLVVWFNLAWIAPDRVKGDPELQALAQKASNFSAADVTQVLQKQTDVLREILPLHRSLQASGQIEVITSPYYHPILPLLMDTTVARRPSPGLPLPQTLLASPEDAAEQLRRAVESHRRHFGVTPRGLWPPEGAVSQELVNLVQLQGTFHWLASDEAILARSLNTPIYRDAHSHVTNPRVLYQPYRLGPFVPPGEAALQRAQQSQAALAIIFRDHHLSDLIGFVYQHMPPTDAAHDLILRLHRIRENLNDPENPYLVSIILDGENCWEYYEHNGDPFLEALYQQLSDDPTLRAVTVSEYLDQFPPRERLSELATGSWIGGDLTTWIGEEAHNRAWELLARTRSRLIAWQVEQPLADLTVLERAWHEIYLAEGSDWFWWYSSRNNAATDAVFDTLFRAHLTQVYITIGLPVPAELREPIVKAARPTAARPCRWMISPPLTASPGLTDDWAGAGCVEAVLSAGTMQRAGARLQRVYYGYGDGYRANLYLRIELGEPVTPYTIAIYLSSPAAERTNQNFRGEQEGGIFGPAGIGLAWEVLLPPGSDRPLLSRADGQNVWRPVAELTPAGRGERIVEIAIPLEQVKLRRQGDQVALIVTLIQDNILVDALPATGYVSFTLT